MLSSYIINNPHTQPFKIAPLIQSRHKNVTHIKNHQLDPNDIAEIIYFIYDDEAVFHVCKLIGEFADTSKPSINMIKDFYKINPIIDIHIDWEVACSDIDRKRKNCADHRF